MKPIVLFALLCQAATVNAQTSDSTAADYGLVDVNLDYKTKGKSGQVYTLKPAIDLPIVGVGAAWSLYAFTKIYDKERTPDAEILALDKNDVNAFDRWSAGYSDPDISKISDYPFYAAMPLPLVLLADREIRKDAAKVGFLYLESMAITGLLYTSSTYFTNRFRPEVYNTDLDLDYRANGNFRNSFFAGHVALVATSSFFVAKVYSDYHPDKAFRHVLYGVAVATTGSMAYFRLKAGKHFLSDTILGIAVGTASGILVPHFHKNVNERRSWSLMPTMGDGVGFSFVYQM